MLGGNRTRHSFFGHELYDCRTVEGLSSVDLATCLVYHGFPSAQYSGHYPQGCPADVKWLTDRLIELEQADLSYPWPFSVDVDEFISAAAQCFARVIDPAWRLRMAVARDQIARFDSLGP